MKTTHAMAGGLLVLALGAGCGDPRSNAQSAADKAANEAAAPSDEQVVFKGDRLVLWGEGARQFPPVVPGSSLAANLMTSSAPEIVSIDGDGSVVARREGTARVRSKSGSSLEVVVHGTAGLVAVPTTLLLAPGAVGSVVVLTAHGRIPSSDVQWSTDDATVAVADNGRVAALRPGRTTVTLHAGSAAAAISVVVAPREKLQPIALTGPSAPVACGSIVQVHLQSVPQGEVAWTSSSAAILKPLAAGMFQAVAPGHAQACMHAAATHGCVTISVR